MAENYKKILDFNSALDQLDLIDVYRILHPTAMERTFFSPVHGTYSKFDHVLNHKASLKKLKNFKIILSTF